MAHHTHKRSAYESLVDRLNRFPQGAPPSETLYRILKILFSEKEAMLASLLPIRPFSVKKAASCWKMGEAEAGRILENFASRAVLLDMEVNGETLYVLPPPMAGFFEFSMMRTREDIDQKLLAELFYQYLNVEEEFVKQLFTEGETQLGRVFVNEESLPADNALYVLDYERATEVIKSSSSIGVGICYCRHKMEHLGRNCDAPLDICMTFNTTAASLVKSGYARAIDSAECIDLLQLAYSHNLVQFGENIRNRVNFICNCCSCCCEAMIAARKYGILNPVHTTNFMPDIDTDKCSGCGRCVSVCPVNALSLVSANDPVNKKRKTVKIDESICLGCGVCVRVCGEKSITLESREERVITPVDSAHKAVLMAIERGKLQNLIFDNNLLMSHRAMAAVLGVILKLPPVKQIMASGQLKSVYVEMLLKRYSGRS